MLALIDAEAEARNETRGRVVCAIVAAHFNVEPNVFQRQMGLLDRRTLQIRAINPACSSRY